MEERLQEAYTYHQTGQLKEAEQSYLEILEDAPDQPDALHLLGMIAYQQEKFTQALDYVQRAIEYAQAPQFYITLGNIQLGLKNLDEARKAYEYCLEKEKDSTKTLAEVHYNLGIILSQLDAELPRAINHYQEAIKLEPDFYPAYNNLGLLYKQQGQLEESVEIFKQALALENEYNSDIHNNLANIYHLQQDYSQAKEHYEKALEIEPYSAVLQHNLGNVWAAMKGWQQAEEYYKEALELRPTFTEAHLHLGYVYQSQLQFEKALQAYTQALTLQSDLDDALEKWAYCFSQVEFNSQNWKVLTSPSYTELLERCFLYKPLGIDKQSLVMNTTLFFKFNPTFKQLFQSLQDGLYSEIATNLVCCEYGAVFQNKVFQALLSYSIITELDFEKMLTILRRIWLAIWEETPEVFKTLVVYYEPFLLALAEQCFNNEYVYWMANEEYEQVERLKKDILTAAHSSQLLESTLEILLFACYCPLMELGLNTQLSNLYSVSWEGLLKRQLIDGEQEQQYQTYFAPNSSPIAQQYDRCPYPRWLSASHFEPASLEVVFRELFPHLQLQFNPVQNPEILVAGCGTGKHPVKVATRFAGSQITAIDISAVSLAYAQRMIQEIGLTNITLQALDIFELGKLHQSFDCIECTGVLQHMPQPRSVLKELLKVLKPQGFLKLGLFSQLSRKPIMEARQIVAEQAISGDLYGVRLTRQELLQSPAALNLLSTVDFYSSSACWHLLFDQTETSFTLLEIADLLEEFSLKFLGFELEDPQLKALYRELFPDEPTLQKLQNWSQLEQQYPQSFQGMYQFWCQKLA